MQVEAPSPTKTATGRIPLPLSPKIPEGFLQVISSCTIVFGHDWRFWLIKCFCIQNHHLF